MRGVLFVKLRDAAVVVARHAAARGRLGHGIQRERSDRAVLPARAFDRPRIARSQRVAVDDQRGSLHESFRELECAAGAERLGLFRVLESHALRRAVAERLTHSGRAVTDAQYRVVHAVGREPLELAREERTPGHGSDGFRHLELGGAGPQSAGEHEHPATPNPD